MASTMMKGIRVEKFGEPDECKFVTDLAVPEPSDDQIQIKVHAAGVNPVDTYIRMGVHARKPQLPYTPGLDSAGLITRVGKNVTKKFAVGDRVFTVNSDSGTYAEYTLSQAKHTFKLNDELSFEEGSAIGIPYFTSYRALHLKSKAQPGEVCLVHGASGAVGIAAMQLAKAHGLTVIGTAGSEAGLALVKEQGADHVFNHREENYMQKIQTQFPQGVEIVLEMLANINLNADLELLRAKTGRVCVIGNRGNVDICPRLLMAKETTVTGVTLFSSDESEFELMYAHLNALMERQCIKPVVGKIYELEQTSQVHEQILNNSGTLGRLTISVDKNAK